MFLSLLSSEEPECTLAVLVKNTYEVSYIDCVHTVQHTGKCTQRSEIKKLATSCTNPTFKAV